MGKVARCRLCLGSYDAAILAVREALKADDANEAALAFKRRLAQIREAEEAYRLAKTGGRWRVARTAWEACVNAYKGDQCLVPVEVQCWDSELAVAERSWERAQDIVGKLAREHPQAMVVILAKTTVQFLCGDLDGALKQALNGLKLDPDNRELKTMRIRVKATSQLSAQGDGHLASLDFGAALQKWKCALDLVPDSLEDGGGGPLRAKLLTKRAKAEYELQQYAEGLKSVDAALKLDITHWEAHLVRGSLNFSLELFDTAVDDFRTSLEHAASDASSAMSKDIVRIKMWLQDAEMFSAEAKASTKDYYKILGLTPDCTQASIRRAYRIESLKHHPDKGGIEEKFKLVNEAYSVLSDPDARHAYDAEPQSPAGSADYYDWD